MIKVLSLMIVGFFLSSCETTATDHYKACVYDLGCPQSEISRRFDEVLKENGKPPIRKPRYI